MKVERRVHTIWIEGAHNLLGHKLVGKWQYIYTTDKGQISLVQLYGYPMGIKNEKEQWESFMWEIYCLKGDLFNDVERFLTKKEAVARIKELFDGQNS